jgi:hypothetical protein
VSRYFPLPFEIFLHVCEYSDAYNGKVNHFQLIRKQAVKRKA